MFAAGTTTATVRSTCTRRSRRAARARRPGNIPNSSSARGATMGWGNGSKANLSLVRWWGSVSLPFTVAAEQGPLAERRDILVYQTAPLAAPLETIGYPETVLFAASNRPDADFFARLIDVAPDGKAIDVTHGMVRARHRESLEKVTL